MKRFFKELIFCLLAIIPFKKDKKIFLTFYAKKHSGGPGRFSNNFSDMIKKSGWYLESFFLSKCKSSIFLSNSLGDFFLKICKLKKIKTILRVDGFFIPDVFNNKKNIFGFTRYMTDERRMVNIRMRKDLELCNHIVYQSRFSKEIADKYLYKRNEAFSVIHNGVDINHFKPLQIQNEHKQILMLGSWRDPDLMICSLNAFKLIKEKYNYKLVIIGKINSVTFDFIDKWLLENKELKTEIAFEGDCSYENLPQEINRNIIAIHLKSGDSCPNSVLEMMACGIPVICQEYGGTKELVENAGVIIKSKPFIYDDNLAIKAFLGFEKINFNLEKFKTKARERIVKEFSLKMMAENYLKVIM